MWRFLWYFTFFQPLIPVVWISCHAWTSNSANTVLMTTNVKIIRSRWSLWLALIPPFYSFFIQFVLKLCRQKYAYFKPVRHRSTLLYNLLLPCLLWLLFPSSYLHDSPACVWPEAFSRALSTLLPFLGLLFSGHSSYSSPLLSLRERLGIFFRDFFPTITYQFNTDNLILIRLLPREFSYNSYMRKWKHCNETSLLFAYPSL